MPTKCVRSNTTIHTRIGLSNRIGVTSNQTESIVTINSIERPKNQRYSINMNKMGDSVFLQAQVRIHTREAFFLT